MSKKTLHLLKYLRHLLGAGVVCGAVGAMLLGCTPKVSSPGDPDLAALAQKPIPPEKTQELLGVVGQNWAYGQGVGETLVNVGGIVLFPPFALYVLGNAAVSLAGYEPFSVSQALPEEQGEVWSTLYQGATEAPGRAVAFVSGEDFRSVERGKDELRAFLESIPEARGNLDRARASAN